MTSKKVASVQHPPDSDAGEEAMQPVRNFRAKGMLNVVPKRQE
ncbi:hypothetical protein [Phyllobacterium ifriqiyense]